MFMMYLSEVELVEDGVYVSLDVLTDSLVLSQIRRSNTHK
jgi:hypothetical protein